MCVGVSVIVFRCSEQATERKNSFKNHDNVKNTYLCNICIESQCVIKELKFSFSTY